MIPNPEYLALANSLTFSIAVSPPPPESPPHSLIVLMKTIGYRTSYRTIHHQLSLFTIHPRFIPILVRTTYRLGSVYRDLYA